MDVTVPARGRRWRGPRALDRIDEYLQGVEDDFADVTVGLTAPTDQRIVLEAVQEIPYGEDASVAQVARMTPDLNDDEEDDLAQVREALAANPVPLLIPDHRVRDGPSAAPPPVEQRSGLRGSLGPEPDDAQPLVDK